MWPVRGGEHCRAWPLPLRVGVVAFATALLLARVSAAGAAAAALYVNTTTDETTSAIRCARCARRSRRPIRLAPQRSWDGGQRVENTIVLGAGTYTLSIAPVGADDDATGDLNVTGSTPLTIIGTGATATVIDATGRAIGCCRSPPAPRSRSSASRSPAGARLTAPPVPNGTNGTGLRRAGPAGTAPAAPTAVASSTWGA